MRQNEALAPWPLIDRYPIIIGQGLSLGYIGQIFRLCLTGFRREYVDLLDELLEKEPHGYAVLAKRIETIACAKMEIVPPEELEGADAKLAEEYAQCSREQILSLPSLTQRLASLMWAEYYSVGALETMWEREGSGWSAVDTSFIHSRRISYPNLTDWSPHIWDLGPVGAAGQSFGKTQGAFGLRMRDYPGKFVVHAPQLRGDYPTREGIGRQIAVWIALKLIASRGASNYLERFSKPLVEGIYNTTEGVPNAQPRVATDDEDIPEAKSALAGWAAGSGAYWLHSDAIKANLLTPDGAGTGKITFADWIALCDSQMSKAVLSATLTTEVGVTGSRAVASEQKKGEDKRYEYSAGCLGDTLKRDLSDVIVGLNFPTPKRKLLPRVILRVGEAPDPMTVLDKADKAARAGVPVDADAIADEVGLPVTKNAGGDPRRMFPVMPAKIAPPPELIGLPKVEEQPGGTQIGATNNQPPEGDDDPEADEPLSAAE